MKLSFHSACFFRHCNPLGQLAPLVELLGNGSLDGVRGRHVLRTLFSRKINVTGDNIMRWDPDTLNLSKLIHV